MHATASLRPGAARHPRGQTLARSRFSGLGRIPGPNELYL